jgi:hypothetical protein
MNYSRHLYAVGGILVLLTALSLGAGGKGAARTQPMPVNVINSTLNPVNTKAVGTTAVSGSVSVAGSVDVSGTVNIGNSQPIAVKNDDSDRTPVSVYEIMGQGSGTAGSFKVIYTVPAGKMLVLQTETFEGQLPGGQQIAIGRLDLNPIAPLITLNYDWKGSISSTDFFQGVSSAVYYLGSGTVISLSVARSDASGNAEYKVGLSGYLVPMPVVGP